MIPLEEAFRILDDSLIGSRLTSEFQPVQHCLGRFLLEDQHAYLDLPPFDKSAMDGYAVLADETSEEVRLVEIVAAGHVGKQKLAPGTTVKVMTGAAVPPGTGRVIMQEHTQEINGMVKIHKKDGPANICRQGEDVQKGDRVLSAGTLLGPVEIANLVSCGITEVEVNRRMRVTVISTGDEIVDSPDRIEPGKIMNSNGPMLALLSESFGLEVVSQQSVVDQPSATVRILQKALEQSDIVMLTGGVSVGEFDFVMDSLSQAGLRVHFSRVAVKPGKPTVFASADGKLAFGLPGNPVSSYLMFHLFVLRAVAEINGSTPLMQDIRLRLGKGIKRRNFERVEFVPCRLGANGKIEALDYHGSAHLAAMVPADGFFQIPAGVAELTADSQVIYTPLPRGCR